MLQLLLVTTVTTVEPLSTRGIRGAGGATGIRYSCSHCILMVGLSWSGDEKRVSLQRTFQLQQPGRDL
jgi:hypothetical protein